MTSEDMAALHARCFTAPRPWAASEFAAIVSDPFCFTLIESAGFIIGRAVAGEAEILTLAVEPDARRRGIGARLVQGFLTKAQNLQAATAFLEVAENNHAAIALYVQAGFAEVGRRRGYYEQAGKPPSDALVLSRLL